MFIQKEYCPTFVFLKRIIIKDYYQILEIPYSADAATIKKSFRRLALVYHPDKNDDPSAHTSFVALQQAYETLGDARSKAIYDLALMIQKPGSLSKKNLKDDQQLLHITTQVLQQLQFINAKHIEYSLLYNYMNWLLQKDTSYYLLKSSDVALHDFFFKNSFQIIQYLIDRFQIAPLALLLELMEAVQFTALNTAVSQQLILMQQNERKRKRLPVLVFIWALIICLSIFIFANWDLLFKA